MTNAKFIITCAPTDGGLNGPMLTGDEPTQVACITFTDDVNPLDAKTLTESFVSAVNDLYDTKVADGHTEHDRCWIAQVVEDEEPVSTDASHAAASDAIQTVGAQKKTRIDDPLCVDSVTYRGITAHISYDSHPFNPWDEYDGEVPVIAVGSFGRFYPRQYCDLAAGDHADMTDSEVISAILADLNVGRSSASHRPIHGAVQGEYGEAIAIATPEWIKATGISKDRVMGQLHHALDQFESFIFGSVYGFEIDGTDLSAWGFIGSDHDVSGLNDALCEAIDSHLDERDAGI